MIEGGGHSVRGPGSALARPIYGRPLRASRRRAAAAAPLAPLSNGTPAVFVGNRRDPPRPILVRSSEQEVRASAADIYPLVSSAPAFLSARRPDSKSPPSVARKCACFGGNRVQRSKTELLADPLTAIQ